VHTIGRHLIAEFYGCRAEAIDDLELVRQSMVAAARAIGSVVHGEAFHRYEPQGVSGILLIAESHLSVHTWPEAAYAAVDIYTCGGLDPRPGFRLLAERLEAQSTRMQEILRGIPTDLERGTRLVPEDVSVITRMAPEAELR